MAKLIGMGGSVSVGATAYPVSEWSLNATNDVQDVTDTASQGWTNRIAGVKSAELTFRAWWGSAAGDLSTVFAIGSVIAATLTIGSTSDIVTGSFVINSFTITNNAKTPVEFQCTAQSDGAVTFP